MSAPGHLRPLLEQLGVDALKCKNCGEFASSYETNLDARYGPQECIRFACSARGCSSTSWAFCCTCKKRFGGNAAAGHVLSKKHKNAHDEKFPNVCNDEASEGIADFPGGGYECASIAGMSTGALLHSLETELTGTYMPGADDEVLEDAGAAAIQEPQNSDVIDQSPRLDMKGNEWLVNALKDKDEASLIELSVIFTDCEMMRDFWFAEHASPSGRSGGGIRYLVQRAFHNRKRGLGCIPDKIPSMREALWHLENFIQYYSMNEKQQQRQARINYAAIGGEQGGSSCLFRKTHLPNFKELTRFYGKTGSRSIWNSLPIPPVQNIGGVSYVSPAHIVKFAFCNGIAMDDILLNCESDQEQSTARCGLVNFVSQSRRMMEWRQTLLGQYSSTHSQGDTMENAVACWVTDWKDGFGPSRTKNNRGSVDACTFTVSPPKDAVNSTNNTFLMACGLKKAEGWREVSRRIHEDLRLLTQTPVLAYHGTLRKTVKVFVKRFASIEDRMERPDSTGTIGCGSDYHRNFGVIGRIQTFKCKADDVEEHLRQEKMGFIEPRFGWSNKFMDRTEKVNGLKFPSCLRCRKKRLAKLGVISADGRLSASECNSCTDWEQLGRNPDLLNFQSGTNYPAVCRCDPTCLCPIQAPPGREVGMAQLPQLKLTFPFLVQAVKYAFYHCSMERNNWTKAMCQEYLRACGLQAKHQDEIFEAAKAARGTAIDYTNKFAIGNFQFPAAWTGDIDLEDYIEAVMHLISLGIAKRQLDLGTLWLKSAEGLSSNKFRTDVQALLKALKPLQLQWLLIYPFGKDNKTGGWVAENWLAFIRISPIIFGWCCQDYDKNVRAGFRDLSRVVLSFHAVVARVMTHGGINDAFIAETDLYMKEFLSCVQELDIRLRYKYLNPKASSNKKEKGANEAFWLKPNIMSLRNLLHIMKVLGPVVLWMDGGGKGEKFIQEVKPFIKCGVREDQKDYFKILQEKVYKHRQISYMEKRFGLLQDPQDGNEDDEEKTAVDLMEALMLADDPDADDGELGSDDEGDEEIDSDLEDGGGATSAAAAMQASFSKVEDEGMLKKSTIYIYRNKDEHASALNRAKPLAGVLFCEENETGDERFAFYTITRVPVKQFLRHRVTFDDTSGLSFGGMWYAGLTVEEEPTSVTSSLPEIKKASKMSAVAIPLWYMVGKDRVDSLKYCVITNWYKVRTSSGAYALPTLDRALYDNTRQALSDDVPTVDVNNPII